MITGKELTSTTVVNPRSSGGKTYFMVMAKFYVSIGWVKANDNAFSRVVSFRNVCACVRMYLYAT